MLSPYKLYKHDMLKARAPITWGPKGHPYKKFPKSTQSILKDTPFEKMKPKGTLCYRHKNVDWAVHRLAPAVAERGKPGGARRKAIGRVAKAAGGGYEGQRRPKITLQRTSPRWGEGLAPSTHGRHFVPLPKKGTAEVSKGTKVAVGATVAGVAGVEAYKHRKQIKNFAHQHVTPHFHKSAKAHIM